MSKITSEHLESGPCDAAAGAAKIVIDNDDVGLDQQALEQAHDDTPQRRRDMQCLAIVFEQVPLQAVYWLHDRLLRVGTMPHLERREAHRFGRVTRRAVRHTIAESW